MGSPIVWHSSSRPGHASGLAQDFSGITHSARLPAGAAGAVGASVAGDGASSLGGFTGTASFSVESTRSVG
jgi:hypothetical protein